MLYIHIRITIDAIRAIAVNQLGKTDIKIYLFTQVSDIHMKSPIICLFVILMLVIPACALFESTSLDQYVAKYNSHVDKAPSVLKTLLGSERVEIDIAQNNGSQLKVGLETNNGLVVQTMKGGIEDPTIQIQTREDVIDTIRSASDPITAFQKAKDAGNITITGNNFFSNLKLNAALSSMDVLRFFYGVLFG